MPADILLPEKGFEKWAVIACDQFTSEPEYWSNTIETVGAAPSALKITLPEIFLGDKTEQRIEKINATMTEYIEKGVLKSYPDSMIYVERTQSDGTVRHGIVGAIDLSDYDYRRGSKALIRATEETVLERIPPRVKIRKDAPIELPHILLLADDPEKTVIEPLTAKKDSMKVAYDFDLMQNGGHITGWFLNPDDIRRVGEAVNSLALNNDDAMMFAVGDGNHSLATAKECSNLNTCGAAGQALVEVVNIHDPAIAFEPIYRVLFGVDAKRVINTLKTALCDGYDGEDRQIITCVYDGGETVISAKPTSKLPVGTLQTVLDKLVKENGIKIDYIHGEDTVKKLCREKNTIGFIFDGMKKDELFDAVRSDGALPRKTFSMGHARDKRYYIEARKIK